MYLYNSFQEISYHFCCKLHFWHNFDTVDIAVFKTGSGKMLNSLDCVIDCDDAFQSNVILKLNYNNFSVLYCERNF